MGSSDTFQDVCFHGFSILLHLFQSSFHLLILHVQLLDLHLGRFRFVEMFIYHRGLTLPESDKIDDVRENLDETIVCRLVQVLEGEIRDTALNQEFSQTDVKSH